MIRKTLRRARAGLLRLVGHVVRYAPAAVFAISDRVAPFLFPGLDAQRLARFFPDLSHDDCRRADLWSRRQLLRNRLLTEAIEIFGYDKRIGSIVTMPPLAAVMPPAIISTFHVGVMPMIGFVLTQLPAEVLVVLSSPSAVRHAALQGAVTRVDEQQRALLFHRGVSALRAGRFVFIAADPRPRGPLSVPFREGSIHLGRGAFALSRITGAPIIPLLARWNGKSVELVIGEPVLPRGDEAETAAEMVSWLDRYLAAAPLEISEQTLSLMT